MTQGVLDQASAGKAGTTQPQPSMLFLRRRQGRRQWPHEGCAGRQGRRPGGDDQRRIAGASGIHHSDRGLSRVHARALSPQVDVRDAAALERLEKLQGQKLGAGENPLLVSVRSGAKFSMPGMMDTILNLGLNDKAVEALAKLSNNPRFAYDSYRRLIQMFGDVVLDVPKKKFEHIFDGVKKREGQVRLRTQPEALQEIIAEYKKLVKKETGKDFPQDPLDQLVAGPRRRLPELAERARQDLSPHQPHRRLAGHSGQRAGHGLRQPGRELRHRRRLHAQSRHRRAHAFFGEYLMNAQGEDVVSGVRTPLPISELERAMPKVYEQLKPSPARWKSTIATCRTSSSPSRMASSTCCRPATASAPAWPPSASPSTWSRRPHHAGRSHHRVEPNQLYDFLVPRLVEKGEKIEVLATGLPASPGAAVGQIVFTAEEAVKQHASGPTSHHPGPRRNHS
jgi:pyruvate,orthophosphate dikinase